MAVALRSSGLNWILLVNYMSTKFSITACHQFLNSVQALLRSSWLPALIAVVILGLCWVKVHTLRRIKCFIHLYVWNIWSFWGPQTEMSRVSKAGDRAGQHAGPKSSSPCIRKHSIQKMDDGHNVRKRFILLKNSVLWELLSLWPDVNVQKLLKMDSSACLILMWYGPTTALA